MKKQLTAITLAIATLSAPSVFSQTPTESNDVKSYIDYNQLKYGTDLISVGSISANVTEKIKLKPDTAEFAIKYTTEGTTPTEASNLNVTNMKVLKSYLEQLGIKQDELATIGYRNYEKTSQKPTSTTQDKLYQTSITVNIILDNNKFYDVIALLEKNGISNLEKQQPSQNYYTFVISEKASDDAAAKQLAQKKYQTIEDQLKAQGINQITIEKYNNHQSEPQQQDVKTYYVENTLKIRTHNFDNLGKAIAKAQELKMNVNNIDYSVSDETKNKLLAQTESQLLAKLTQKAQLLLGQKDYQLGAPQNLQIIEDNNFIQPRNYNYGKLMSAPSPELAGYTADAIDIQPPTDFEINVTLTGNFDILKPVHKP